METIEALKRDELGYGIHYLIPESQEEYIDLSKIHAFHGRQFSKVEFEYDASEELLDRYYGKDEQNIADWHPTPPGKNWTLISVTESDDGPVAIFVSSLS